MALRERNVGAVNEWGKLREAVVGIEDNTTEPSWIPALVWLDETGQEYVRTCGGRRTEDIAPHIAEALRLQLDNHARILEQHGVIVHRTPPLVHEAEKHYLADVQQGNMLFGAADFFRFFGDTALLLNSFRMPFRRKQVFMTRPVLERLLKGTGGVYVATPPPSPHYDPEDLFLENGDIMCDGENVYVGLSGNASSRAGIEWLTRFLGRRHTVHVIPLASDRFHLDWVLSLNRPGLLTYCPQALTGELPPPLRSWDKIEVAPHEAAGANNLSLDENTILVAEQYGRIAAQYARRGMTVVTEPLDATISYGSGPRCLTAVVRRDS